VVEPLVLEEGVGHFEVGVGLLYHHWLVDLVPLLRLLGQLLTLLLHKREQNLHLFAFGVLDHLPPDSVLIGDLEDVQAEILNEVGEVQLLVGREADAADLCVLLIGEARHPAFEFLHRGRGLAVVVHTHVVAHFSDVL